MKDRTTRQMLTSLIGLFLFLLGCSTASQLLQPTPTPWPTPAAVEKPRYRVERTNLKDSFQVEGEVVPKVYQPLSFTLEGRLGAIHVTEGQKVQAGDLLAELDQSALTTQLEQAQQTLEQAQDALWGYETAREFDLKRATLERDLAQAKLERAAANETAADVAVYELEVQLRDLDVAEIEAKINPALERDVAKAEATAAALQTQVDALRLYAPFDGWIATAEIGATHTRGSLDPPQPGDLVQAGQPLFVLAQPGEMEIIIRADQPRIAEISAGQAITITRPWAREQPFAAEVAAIRPVDSAQTRQVPAPAVAVLPVRTSYPQLAVGNRLEIEVVAALYPNTLILPPGGVREFAGRTFVVLEEGARQRRVDVRVGLRGETFVQILEGLEAGQEVIGP